MNKLQQLRANLVAQKTKVDEKLLQASLSAEQKTALEDVLKKIEENVRLIDEAAEQATNEQLMAIFTQAIEAFKAASEQNMQEVQASLKATNAEMLKLQAKIEGGGSSKKKFKASVDFKLLKSSDKIVSDGFKPYSAGVDVTAYTPEAEIETVEVFHPLIGVTQGFEYGTTSKETIKVRKLSKDSGGCSVVLDHAAKPVVEYIGAQSVVNVSTFAGIVEGIADEDLEDNPTLQTEIQNEAFIDLAEYENTAAIAILESAGQAYANTNFGTKAGADTRTAVAAILDQVRQALGKRTSRIAFALNSSQWALLEDLRASDSGVLLGVDSLLGDVIKVVDNSLTTDKFYCWAQKFAKVKMYKSPKETWYQGVQVTKDGANVTAVYSEYRTDETSLRVRQRQAMYITDATTVVKGTLSGVVAALLPQQP